MGFTEESFSLIKFAEIINKGMWVADSSHCISRRLPAKDRIVVKAWASGENTMIDFSNGNSLLVSGDYGRLLNPWTIDVYRVTPRKQKKSMSDGGGYHMVLVTEVVFRFINYEILKKDRREKREQRELEIRQKEMVNPSGRHALLALRTFAGVLGGGMAVSGLQTDNPHSILKLRRRR